MFASPAGLLFKMDGSLVPQQATRSMTAETLNRAANGRALYPAAVSIRQHQLTSLAPAM